jgi:DNA-binding MarR family transcriptional regulator
MTATSGPDLRLFTGYLLRHAFVKAVGVAKECIPPEAHVRDVAVMAILAEQGAVSQRSLGDVTHVNRTLIVKLIDKLEANGWVVRDRNPQDRRSYALRLTAEGAAALAELRADLDEGDAKLTIALTSSEREHLNRHLRILLTGDAALRIKMLADKSGYLIAQAHRLLRDWAERSLAQLDLHPRDFGLLAVLGRDEPCSQNHLAAKLGVTPPAVLMFLDELEGRGLVSRSRNTDDRRVYDVTMTTSGRRLLRAAQRAAAILQARAVERLGVDGDAELRELLLKLLDPEV